MFFVRLRALVQPAMENVCSVGILPAPVNFKVPLVKVGPNWRDMS